MANVHTRTHGCTHSSHPSRLQIATWQKELLSSSRGGRHGRRRGYSGLRTVWSNATTIFATQYNSGRNVTAQPDSFRFLSYGEVFHPAACLLSPISLSTSPWGKKMRPPPSPRRRNPKRSSEGKGCLLKHSARSVPLRPKFLPVKPPLLPAWKLSPPKPPTPPF